MRILTVAVLMLAAAATAPAAQGAFPVGKKAPVFALKQLDGSRVSLAGLKGKVVLLDFWMPACPPCEVAAPLLQKMQSKYHSRGLRLVGVTQTDPPPAAVRAFQQRHRLRYPLVIDRGMNVGRAYRLEAHPTVVLVDRRGVVRYVHAGFLQGEEKQIEAAVKALLAGRPVPRS